MTNWESLQGPDRPASESSYTPSQRSLLSHIGASTSLLVDAVMRPGVNHMASTLETAASGPSKNESFAGPSRTHEEKSGNTTESRSMQGPRSTLVLAEGFRTQPSDEGSVQFQAQREFDFFRSTSNPKPLTAQLSCMTSRKSGIWCPRKWDQINIDDGTAVIDLLAGPDFLKDEILSGAVYDDDVELADLFSLKNGGKSLIQTHDGLWSQSLPTYHTLSPTNPLNLLPDFNLEQASIAPVTSPPFVKTSNAEKHPEDTTAHRVAAKYQFEAWADVLEGYQDIVWGGSIFEKKAQKEEAQRYAGHGVLLHDPTALRRLRVVLGHFNPSIDTMTSSHHPTPYYSGIKLEN